MSLFSILLVLPQLFYQKMFLRLQNIWTCYSVSKTLNWSTRQTVKLILNVFLFQTFIHFSIPIKITYKHPEHYLFAPHQIATPVTSHNKITEAAEQPHQAITFTPEYTCNNTYTIQITVANILNYRSIVPTTTSDPKNQRTSTH